MNLTLFGVPNIPMVEPGDNLLGLIDAGLSSINESLQVDDVILLAQKIVSKAEDRYVDLNTVSPSADARSLAL